MEDSDVRHEELQLIVSQHVAWLRNEEGGQCANLSGADLRWANLRAITLCSATIDGAVVRAEDIGGPGHILCALTDDEWNMIQKGRQA